MKGIPLIRDPAILEGYLTDASNTRGQADALVRPRSTAEVAQVVQHCQAEGIPLTVTAQRTSTTGGPVPRGGWLLSTEALDQIHSLEEVDAGVILGQYQATVDARGWLFPPDPTSRHECALGAAIACNASGARSFRYGPTRPWVERVEAVLATGEVVRADRDTPLPPSWPGLRWQEPRVKTAAGYYPANNLLDLLIGSEGTLAVITRAWLRLAPQPPAVLALVGFFESSAEALQMVELARAGASRPGRPADAPLNPRAIEYFDHHALDLIRARVPEVPPGARAALLFEVEHPGEAPVDAWWDALVQAKALVDHTLVADNETELARLHALRHAVPAGVNEQVVRNGMPKIGTDFAVPDGALVEMMGAYEAVGLPHILFGHIGDNHLHLNLLPRDRDELAEARRLYRTLALRAVSLGGTVSAEHGIGKIKTAFLADMVGPETLAAFRALKRAADPAGILGRGNLFDPEADHPAGGAPCQT